MLENFEKFTEQGRSFKPKISIRKMGQIGFNNGAKNRFNLEKFDLVVLYYNKVQSLIAFKFTNNKDEEGAIRINKRKHNIFVAGKKFFDYYEIVYRELSGSYDVDWKPENNIAIIDLAQHTKMKRTRLPDGSI